jgi:hypothetical protein
MDSLDYHPKRRLPLENGSIFPVKGRELETFPDSYPETRPHPWLLASRLGQALTGVDMSFLHKTGSGQVPAWVRCHIPGREVSRSFGRTSALLGESLWGVRPASSNIQGCSCSLQKFLLLGERLDFSSEALRILQILQPPGVFTNVTVPTMCQELKGGLSTVV